MIFLITCKGLGSVGKHMSGSPDQKTVVEAETQRGDLSIEGLSHMHVYHDN